MKSNKIFTFSDRGAKAVGRFSGIGKTFTVFAGAKVSDDETDEFATCSRSEKRLRNIMMEEHIIKEGILTVDYTFSSQSCAEQGTVKWKQF